MKRFVNSLVALTGCAFLSGCSAGMATHGVEPNLSLVQVGVERVIVEHELGSPVGFVSNENGQSACIYEYELGDEYSEETTIHYDENDKVQKVM